MVQQYTVYSGYIIIALLITLMVVFFQTERVILQHIQLKIHLHLTILQSQDTHLLDGVVLELQEVIIKQ